MACRSGCPTQDHQSWGECARASRLMVGWVQHIKGLERDREKNWFRELDAYADARKEGIQPDSTKRADTERALRVSDTFGKAYDGASPASVLVDG